MDNVIKLAAVIITQITMSSAKGVYVNLRHNTGYPFSYSNKLNISLGNVSNGLISLSSSYTQHYKSNSKFIYLVDERQKNILDAYGGQSISTIAMNTLKAENDQQEHTASFGVSHSDKLKELMEDISIKRLLVIVYKDCNNTITNHLRSKFKESNVKSVCNSIYEDQILHNIPQILEKPEMVLLLLSVLDANVVLERMLRFAIKRIIFITTGIPVHVFKEMKILYPKLNMVNLPNSVHEDIILDTKKVTKLLQENDLSNIFKVLPMLYTSINKNGGECSHLKINFFTETWRAVSLLRAPYCVLLPFEPENDVCVVGIPCRVPDTSKNNKKWNFSCCSGMAVDLFMLILKEWQVNVELYIAEDGAFGAIKNGTWNGIINEVYSGNADIGIQALTPTVERIKVVDFSKGYQYSYFSIIRRTTLKKLSFITYEFLEPLDDFLLIIIAASSIILQIMLFLFENVTTRGLKIEKRFTWRDVLAYSTGLVFQRDIGGRNPISIYGRLSSLAFAVSMTVIMSTYTAKLTANEVNNQRSDDFLGITDPKVLSLSFAINRKKILAGGFDHT
ncbi:glutamate receptor ionotropic, NMDA 2A-like [Hydractinia symbiolongicarpus]|uniref:glutamate receptor ionotropic, NMDA 2A-like n=1 Tax=Hydractinia symbiolongicarpus TaxID=13093 RepID=UPI00254C385E|nr:glutamate receptor ionotropic, NMDA 2A-like [Hydractinia symbiolongicarpus]